MNKSSNQPQPVPPPKTTNSNGIMSFLPKSLSGRVGFAVVVLLVIYIIVAATRKWWPFKKTGTTETSDTEDKQPQTLGASAEVTEMELSAGVDEDSEEGQTSGYSIREYYDTQDVNPKISLTFTLSVPDVNSSLYAEVVDDWLIELKVDNGPGTAEYKYDEFLGEPLSPNQEKQITIKPFVGYNQQLTTNSDIKLNIFYTNKLDENARYNAFDNVKQSDDTSVKIEVTEQTVKNLNALSDNTIDSFTERLVFSLTGEGVTDDIGAELDYTGKTYRMKFKNKDKMDADHVRFERVEDSDKIYIYNITRGNYILNEKIAYTAQPHPLDKKYYIFVHIANEEQEYLSSENNLSLTSNLDDSSKLRIYQDPPIGPLKMVLPTYNTINRGSSLSGADTDQLVSPNKEYFMAIQGDGNVVIYDKTEVIWSTGTGSNKNKKPFILNFRGDGNLVLHPTNDQTPEGALWSTGTNGEGGEELVLTDGGILKIIDVDGELIWSSGDDEDQSTATPTGTGTGTGAAARVGAGAGADAATFTPAATPTSPSPAPPATRNVFVPQSKSNFGSSMAGTIYVKNYRIRVFPGTDYANPQGVLPPSFSPGVYWLYEVIVAGNYKYYVTLGSSTFEEINISNLYTNTGKFKEVEIKPALNAAGVRENNKSKISRSDSIINLEGKNTIPVYIKDANDKLLRIHNGNFQLAGANFNIWQIFKFNA